MHKLTILGEEAISESLSVAKFIAELFAQLISRHGPGECFVYDSKGLPLPKKVLDSGCRLWIKHGLSNGERESWVFRYPLLAQYQEGVGDTPIALNGNSILSSSSHIGVPLQSATQELQEYGQIVQDINRHNDLVEKVTKERRQRREWIQQKLELSPVDDSLPCK